MNETLTVISFGVGVFTTLAGAALTVYVALARYALTQKEHELERRFTEQALRIASVDGRVASIDILHRDLSNKVIELGAVVHGMGREFGEVKQSMVKKAEWEQHRDSVDKKLDAIETKLDRILETRGARV